MFAARVCECRKTTLRGLGASLYDSPCYPYPSGYQYAGALDNGGIMLRRPNDGALFAVNAMGGQCYFTLLEAGSVGPSVSIPSPYPASGKTASNGPIQAADPIMTIQPYGPSLPVITDTPKPADYATPQIEPVYAVIQGEASDTPASPTDSGGAVSMDKPASSIPWGLILGALALLAN